MRAIHLARYEGAYPGSFVAMLRAVLEAARNRGWRAEAIFAESVAGRPWVEGLRQAGLRVRVMPVGSRRRLVREIRALLAEAPGEPTVLHTHFTDFDLPALFAAGGRARTAVFWHLHTPNVWTLPLRARAAVKFGIYGRRVDRILCVAPHMVDTLAARAPREKVHFFRNAIDVDVFRPASPEERREARRALGLPDGEEPVLLHFGWDWHVKGGDLFLHAVRLLREERPTIRAVTRTEDPEAEHMIEELDLSDTVRVVPFVDHASLYAAADALVSSSRSEGMPFTLAEALSSGVPVVASDISGHALIARETPACVLRPLDPAAIAGGIRVILARDPELARREGQEARTLIAERMGLSAWAARLLALYERTLPAGR